MMRKPSCLISCSPRSAVGDCGALVGGGGGFFLATSAAAAAGYTLAAGPVRADAIQTDTDGLTTGDAKIKVADGEMPVYYARPPTCRIRP